MTITPELKEKIINKLSKESIARIAQLTTYEFIIFVWGDPMFFKIVWSSSDSLANSLVSCWILDINTIRKKGPEAWKRIGLASKIYETPTAAKSLEILKKYI